MLNIRRAVLHVDDDPLITRIVGDALREAGYETEAVNDPNEAIEAIVRGQHRIVVLDIHMPGKSGLQLLEEIQRLDAGIRCVMLSALVNETTVIEANRLGAEACLFKPFDDPQPLLDAVEGAHQRNQAWWCVLRELTQRRQAFEEAAASV